MSTTFSVTPGTVLPRHLVHKRADTEVFLTGWSAHADDAFTITARWPRTHSFYQPLHRHYDSLLFAETVRQTLPLLSHEVFGVPLGHQLIWADLSFHVVYDALQVSDQPLDLTLTVECGESVGRRTSLSAVCVSVTAFANAATLGHARTRFSAYRPGVYQRLRAGRHDPIAARATALHPAPGVLPAGVGRHLAEDVVLAPTRHPHVWQLRADLDHPILFDHPVDHVPGMLLLEAARQAAISAHSAGNTTVTSMTIRFHRYVELDRPAWVQLTPHAHDLFHVRIDQGEHTCFEAEVVAHAPVAVHRSGWSGASS